MRRTATRSMPLVGLVGLVVGLVGHTRPLSGWLPAWRPNTSAPLDQILGTTALWALAGITTWAALGGAAYALIRIGGHFDVTRPTAWGMPRWCRRGVDRLAATVIWCTLLGSAGPVLAVEDAPTEALEATNPRSADLPHPGLSRLARSSQNRTDPPLETAGPEPQPAEHVVVRGDNLWRIAAGRLAAHPDATLTLREYWLLVIDVNRDRIRSGDPDLIFPGETIVLPPLGETR